MAAYLFDENLPPNLARGLRFVGFDAYAVGDDPAPPRGSTDATNVGWCRGRGAVLVTTDRGRKDREILDLLRRYPDAHVVFVPEGFTAVEVSKNFHKRVERIEETLVRGKRVRLKITRRGGCTRLE